MSRSALDHATQSYARQAAAHRGAAAELRERGAPAGEASPLERWHIYAAQLLDRTDRSERREVAHRIAHQGGPA